MTTRTQTQNFSSASVVLGAQEALSTESINVSASTIAVIIPDGSSATYSVEYTLDDVNTDDIPGVDHPAVVWFTANEFPVGSNTTLYASLSYPVEFVRINVQALVGDLTFKVLQSFH